MRGTNGQAAFAAALRARLNPGARKDVARVVGVTAAMVSNWSLGKGSPPTPDQVFKIEEALGVPDGYLTRHLGYERVGSTSVLAAIEADPGLSPRSRNALEALYLSLVSSSGGAES